MTPYQPLSGQQSARITKSLRYFLCLKGDGMQTLEIPANWIPIAEYARRFGKNQEYVRRLAREHKIPAVKHGYSYLIYVGEDAPQPKS